MFLRGLEDDRSCNVFFFVGFSIFNLGLGLALSFSSPSSPFIDRMVGHQFKKPYYVMFVLRSKSTFPECRSSSLNNEIN